MADKTKIEWTDATINPVIGCSKISPGCANCYAEKMAKRLKKIGTRGYADVVDQNGWTGKTVFVPSELEKPYRWKKPRKIFMCSMSDIFHESVGERQLSSIYRMVKENRHHIFQALTKRAHNYAHLAWATEGFHTLPNFWLGVTVENQEQADKRIPILLQIPAAVRGVSIEPMLGPIALEGLADGESMRADWYREYLTGGLDWVICGGESGPGRRPFNPDWARDLRDRCKAAGVPFFFKQTDKVTPIPDDLMIREWPR